MKERLVLLQHELKHLSEEIFTVKNEKDKLTKTEESLYLLFQKKLAYCKK